MIATGCGLLNVALARQDPFVLSMNAIRLTLVALLIAGGLSLGCRLTAKAASPAPAKAKAAAVCQLGTSC